MVRFLLKLESDHTIVDAVEHADRLDEAIWRQMVASHGGLDVLHSGTLNPGARLDAIQVRRTIEFARRYYKAICVDLSGNLEKYSVELMHESKRILLVTTTEVSSLHLAHEKLQYLRRIELGERVAVLLNRYSKRATALTVEDVQSVLGVPVLATFANDYARLSKAVGEGKPIDPASELGSGYAALADTLIDRRREAAPRSKRSLMEYFTIAPSRFQPGGRVV